MTTTTSSRRAGHPLKSPLAIPSEGVPASGAAGTAAGQSLTSQPLSERAATAPKFEDYLRTTNNRDGRPYAEASINAYVSPARHLDAWLTANGIEGDFTVADTAMLNRYFREYYREHGQGGTHILSFGWYR